MVYKIKEDFDKNGATSLTKERRPRNTKSLTPEQWQAHLDAATDPSERARLEALREVSAQKITLNEAAEALEISPQGLMKFRAKFLALAILAAAIFLFMQSCAIRMPKPTDYDYFYYSQSDHEIKKQMIELGVKPAPNFAYLDGVEFTCWCKPAYIDSAYRASFPDVRLVKKVPKGTANVSVSF